MIVWNIVLNVGIITAKVAAVSLLLLLARGIVWLLNMLLVLPLFDPLNNIPGPSGSTFQNHFGEVMDPDCSPDTHEEWKKLYGHTFRFHGFGKHDYRLMSFDFRVISHVLTSPLYEKPWQTRALLARLIGRGIFSMEGPEHKLQRRLIAPAFTLQSTKAMAPIFFRKAEELCSRWDSLIDEPFVNSEIRPSDPPPAYAPFATASERFKGATIDIAHWLARASFDVVGLAGFGYHFNALECESEGVYLAFRRMLDVADKGPQFRGLIELFFPIVRKFWPDEGTRITDESLRVISKAGKKLIADKKAAVLAESSSARETEDKDILTLLIKANLTSDLANRLPDESLFDQCATFLLAGSDTVSLALAWCIRYLSLHPEIQIRLREEILSLPMTPPPPVSAQNPLNSKSFDIDIGTNLNSHICPPPSYPTPSHTPQEHYTAIEELPYLDAVIRETLRFCPPIHATIRVAAADDHIPISHPIVLQDGTIVNKGESIRIRKGSYVHIPIEGLNLCEEIWGSDARQFNPDRWANLPPNARSPAHPGLGNSMTFSFGPHSCLGYKFTIAETKVFLATIMPQFVFTPAEGVEITKFNNILTRPYIKDQLELGARLPVVVGRYSR